MSSAMSNDLGGRGTPRKRRRISLIEEDEHVNKYDSGKMTDRLDRSDLAFSSTAPAAEVSNTEVSHMEEDAKIPIISTDTKLAEQTVSPFLAQHVSSQHALLETSGEGIKDTTNKVDNTKKYYCYRHRPGAKCRRQVNEPSMEELQRV